MLAKQGIEVRFAKSNKPEDIASLIDAKTKAVFCESIGYPAGNIIDIEPIAAQAHAKGVSLIVDNTFATPILLNQIYYGAEIVVHALRPEERRVGKECTRTCRSMCSRYIIK